MSLFKRAFNSRFEDRGVIVEIDWSQLEICCLQIESQCFNLGQELRNGVDLHSAMTAVIYGEPYGVVNDKVHVDKNPQWIARRRVTKRARFALQYGASAKRISELTGWDTSFSRDFIKTYYRKYPEIETWQRGVAEEVERTAKVITVTPDGLCVKRGQYTSPTGRRFVFDTVEDTRKGGAYFSPTQLKNYPIQGLAADFVAFMLVALMDRITEENLHDRALLVNTIHDSVILDVHKDVESNVINIITDVYNNARAGMEIVVNMKRKVDVPLKYEISSGSTWSK